MKLSDISESDMFARFAVVRRLNNGKFYIDIFDRESNSNDIIGVVEGFNGLWTVNNDPKFDTSSLIKAIKKAIDNYLRYEKEFSMEKEKFLLVEK